MLVFISDVHFVDETAGKHNVPARAFEGVFEDLKRYGGTPPEIKLLFLGDIFDINRTTYWLGVDESERPWGDMENKKDIIERHANTIMDEIIEKNKDTFTILKGALKEQFGFPEEPERIYIPGNHDRLCSIFPSLREKIRRNLRISGGVRTFPPSLRR